MSRPVPAGGPAAGTDDGLDPLAVGPDRSLSVDDVVAVARHRRPARLSEAALPAMESSRAVVEQVVAEGRTVYGITTGFGDLSTVRVTPQETGALQRNLVRSHAAGVGEPLPAEVIRAMLLLRAAALAQGLSGVRPDVVVQLLALLQADILPVVPSRGSVGASGDLAPLAHLALAVIGEGSVMVGGELLPAADAMRRAGIDPIELGAKEGLALLNGTQLMSAVGSIGLADARRLADSADAIAAMSVEAMRGSDEPFSAAIHSARPHLGQQQVAATMRRLLADSPNRARHRDDDHRVQDAYSLRCIPQVHGAARDALGLLGATLAIEINSVTDNPLVLAASAEHPNGAILSGGNFHGEPIAIPLDVATIAVTELASIAERRIARLVDASLSGGLPPFLTAESGRNSGYMVAQYTAAALVNELQSLAHPSSVHSLPTSANQEDHVSMGATAALQFRAAVEHAERVLAIEAMCAAQGLDFLPDPVAPLVAAAHATVRSAIPHLDEDRSPADDIARATQLIRDGALATARQAEA